MLDSARFRLSPRSTALVLVDFQERLYRAMEPERREEVLSNAVLLLKLAQTLGLPVLVTEQYPAGLGATVPAIKNELPGGTPILEKLVFSAWGAEGFPESFRSLNARSAVVAGMESHVCVLGTALDLLDQAVAVHVAADAVISRTRANWQTGLRIMEKAGAVVSSTETVIFQLLGRAGTEAFKAMSKLLR
jgi:nicotinamidase-related amidase